MRKLMLSLVVLGGVAAFGGAAGAAPVMVAPVVPAAFDGAQVQTVQYGPGWRGRHEWRRRQAWRHHRWERRHGYYAGRGYR